MAINKWITITTIIRIRNKDKNKDNNKETNNYHNKYVWLKKRVINNRSKRII